MTKARSLRRTGGIQAIAVLAMLSAAGCGMPLIGHHGDLTQRSNTTAHASMSKPTDARAAKSKQSGARAENVKSAEAAHASDPVSIAHQRMASEPAQPYWPYRLATLQLDDHAEIPAESSLVEALRRDPDYAPALALISKLDFDHGRNLDAIHRLETARTRAAASGARLAPELLAALALHYDAIDRLDRVRPITSELAIEASNRPPSAFVFLTLRGASPDSAIEPASRAVRERPKSAVDQNNFGITRLRSGDPQAARKAFEAAIRLDPALPGPYYNLAILEKYYALDDSAAVGWFRRYRERSNEDPDGLARVFAPAESKPVAQQKGD